MLPKLPVTSSDRKPRTVASGRGGSLSGLPPLKRTATKAHTDVDLLLAALPKRVRAITEAVAAEYDVSLPQLLADQTDTSRTARQAAWWLVNKVLGSTMTGAEIAVLFQRDRTSVRGGIKRFYERMKQDPKLAARMSTLVAYFTAR